MKKSTPKKIKKLTPKKLKELLWIECRRLANTLYIEQNGTYKCFTCGNTIEGSNKQLGHFLARSICGAYLKYDMRNLRWQCYRCNINLSGNGAIFYKKLVDIEGQEYVDTLFKDKQRIVKETDHYLQLLEEYKKL